jgi:hypothetical protein
MKNLLKNPLPGARRHNDLPLWFGLNAVVALGIGFVFGWAVRPAATSPSRAQNTAVRILPVPAGVEVVEDHAPARPPAAPGHPLPARVAE